MEPLLSQDQKKKYNLLEEGKIALGMLEYGRKRFGKRKAAIIDKLGEMFKLGEYPRVVRQVVVSRLKVSGKYTVPSTGSFLWGCCLSSFPI